MKKNIFLLFVAFFNTISYAQPTAIQWQRSFGSSNRDNANDIQQTADGGYIIAGYSNGFDGDVTGNHGDHDYWIVKVSASGAIQWQKSLGGSAEDEASSVLQTSDGGYIVAGKSKSNNGDVTGNHGSFDFWVVKLTSSGAIDWQKSLGGTWDDEAKSIRQTSDGGYIAAGLSVSNDGDVSGTHGSADYWVVKMNNIGGIEWQKTFGGSGWDAATSAQQTADGGYIVAGFSSSNNGDVTDSHGFTDFWVIKLSTLGTIQWKKAYGGSDLDFGKSIRQTLDGGYILVGYSHSNDGDVSGNNGNEDYWVLKLSSLGSIQWQRSLGGTGLDEAVSVQQTSDGGYIVLGFSSSTDGDVTGNHGLYDYWMLKLSGSGSLLWQKSFGGTSSDYSTALNQTSDGGFILAGSSWSNDGDVSGNHGNTDYWVVKLQGTVSVNQIGKSPVISIIPNPTTGNITLKGPGVSKIKVYSTMGELIVESENTGIISLSEFPPNMYFVNVFNEYGELLGAEKIIKQ